MTGPRRILRLRAFDGYDSDQAAWELWRSEEGYSWWFWPSLSANGGWERMRAIPVSRTVPQAEAAARKWFATNEPELQIEITAGHSEATA